MTIRLSQLASVVLLLAAWPASGEEPKLDQLIVYGEGFAFGVREPEGWRGDTENAAGVHANILFYRNSETFNRAKALIRVRVNNKVDEDTAGDLEYDMKGYKERLPDVQFADLPMSHPGYALFSKTFFVPKKFYEYVVYVNPGPGKSKSLSASMYKRKKEATVEELAVFESVVASLTLLSDGPKPAPH